MSGAPAPVVAAAPTSPRARSGLRESRLALPVSSTQLPPSFQWLVVQLALSEVAPTLPGAGAPTERAAASMPSALRRRGVGAYTGVVPAEDLAPCAIVLVPSPEVVARSDEALRASQRFCAGASRSGRAQRSHAQGEHPRSSWSRSRRSAAPLAVMTRVRRVMFDSGRWLLVVAIALEIWAVYGCGGSSGSPRRPRSRDASRRVIVDWRRAHFRARPRGLVTRAPMVARLPEARRLLADSPRTRASEAFARSGAPDRRRHVWRVGARRDAVRSPLANLLVHRPTRFEQVIVAAKPGRPCDTDALSLALCVLPALLWSFVDLLLSLLA